MSAVAAATTSRSDAASTEAYAERLYERHQRAIYGFCLKQLRRREDADDAVQMTFIYALTSLRRGVVPQLELPWLFTIARNVCSTRRRSGMRRGEYETPQDLDAIQDKLAVPDRSDVATTEDFVAALRDVPEGQRKALLLREWRGLSYEEIGAELGLSQAATEALLFRARQNVARRLDERTGVKTLQGLPFVSFLRDLFQTGAAKLIAIGAGAALTVVAVPAAQHDARPAPTMPAHVQRHVAPAVARHASPHARSAARTTMHRKVATWTAGRNVLRSSPSMTPVTAAPPPQSPPPPSASGGGDGPAPKSATPNVSASTVIDTVRTAVELPPVSLPSVPQLPPVTVQAPTATVTVPSVQLP
jgi:RNA polymerase sigma-70 factor, ECF subfamily